MANAPQYMRGMPANSVVDPIALQNAVPSMPVYDQQQMQQPNYRYDYAPPAAALEPPPMTYEQVEAAAMADVNNPPPQQALIIHEFMRPEYKVDCKTSFIPHALNRPTVITTGNGHMHIRDNDAIPFLVDPDEHRTENLIPQVISMVPPGTQQFGWELIGKDKGLRARGKMLDKRDDPLWYLLSSYKISVRSVPQSLKAEDDSARLFIRLYALGPDMSLHEIFGSIRHEPQAERSLPFTYHALLDGQKFEYAHAFVFNPECVNDLLHDRFPPPGAVLNTPTDLVKALKSARGKFNARRGGNREVHVGGLSMNVHPELIDIMRRWGMPYVKEQDHFVMTMEMYKILKRALAGRASNDPLIAMNQIYAVLLDERGVVVTDQNMLTGLAGLVTLETSGQICRIFGDIIG